MAEGNWVRWPPDIGLIVGEDSTGVADLPLEREAISSPQISPFLGLSPISLQLLFSPKSSYFLIQFASIFLPFSL
jgi:hypothetical protein